MAQMNVLPGSRRIRPLRVVRLALRDFFADEMTTYAAALAYRVLFSLFPFLIFLTSLLGFFGAPQLFEWMRDQAAYVLPPQGMDLVNTVLGELRQTQGGLLSAAVALAVFSASMGVLGTMDALNVAYDVSERRPTWKRFVVAVVYTVALALMLVIAAAAMISGPALLEWVARHVGLDALFIAVWSWLRWGVAVLLLMLVVSLVYYAAPNVKQPFRLITPGAVIAVAAWIAASLAFGYYVQNFASYNRTYGSIGAVIVLLFYFYISAAVMLFGAELNAVLTREAGEKIEESAGGPGT
jgi:membrane protein